MAIRIIEVCIVCVGLAFKCEGITPLQDELLHSINTGDPSDDFVGIFARSGVSSNEFSQALIGLEDYERNASSNRSSFVRRIIVTRLCEMGTTNAVESLMWLLRNSENDGERLRAFRGLVRISGLDTDILKGFSPWMTSTNRLETVRRAKVYRVVSSTVVDLGRPPSEKMTASCYLGSFLMSESQYPKELDEAMIAVDPTYTMSRRRLSNLRSILPRVRLSAQKRYIASAIMELENYPEADLPD